MSDLPNYQQIKAWLGPGWIATNIAADIGEVPATWDHNYWPAPWYLFGSSYICYLLHTDGTRVEVRTPSDKERRESWLDADFFRIWFRAIQRRQSHGGEFDLSGVAKKCITWHDPPEPKRECPTDHVWSELIGQCGTCLVEESARSMLPKMFGAVRRVPPPQTSAGSEPDLSEAVAQHVAGEALTPEALKPWEDMVVSDVVQQLRQQKRWPSAEPAWIPALEAKLADQLRSGGYDCVEQRNLMVRAMRVAAEAEERAKGYYGRSQEGRKDGLHDSWVSKLPATTLSRFELPDSQRLDRKRTGR